MAYCILLGKMGSPDTYQWIVFYSILKKSENKPTPRKRRKIREEMIVKFGTEEIEVVSDKLI